MFDQHLRVNLKIIKLFVSKSRIYCHPIKAYTRPILPDQFICITSNLISDYISMFTKQNFPAKCLRMGSNKYFSKRV